METRLVEEEASAPDMEETTRTDRSRPPPPERAPWLVFFAQGKGEKIQTFFSIAQGRKHVRRVRAMREKSCLMVSQYGWLLMKERTSKKDGGGDCFLLNPAASMEVIHLPPLPPDSEYTSKRHEYRCIMSSPPTDPNCVICFFDKKKARTLFLHPIERKWCKTEYTLPGGEYDSFRGDHIKDVALCNGKIYAVTKYRRTLIIDFNPYPAMRLIETAGKAHFLFLLVRYSCALVESCGELYLVCTVYTGGTRVIHTFRILKMDFSEMKWVSVDSIGDRAFFLSDAGRPFSCSAAESGVEGDSIYYVVYNDPCIYRFDMTDKSITRDHALCGNISTPWHEAYWVLPSSQ